MGVGVGGSFVSDDDNDDEDNDHSFSRIQQAARDLAKRIRDRSSLSIAATSAAAATDVNSQGYSFSLTPATSSSFFSSDKWREKKDFFKI